MGKNYGCSHTRLHITQSSICSLITPPPFSLLHLQGCKPVPLWHCSHLTYPHPVHTPLQCVCGKYLLDAHLGNGTDRRTATLMTPLLFTSGLVRYEAVLQSCRTSPVGGWAPTCNSAHSWQLHRTVSLEHQVAGTITCYPTQSHYPDIEPTSPFSILIMLNARIGSDRYQF